MENSAAAPPEADQAQQPAEDGTGSAETEDCIMCCEPIKLEDSKSLRCGHRFHAGCLQTWLQRKPTCPMCREDAREEAASATQRERRG